MSTVLSFREYQPFKYRSCSVWMQATICRVSDILSPVEWMWTLILTMVTKTSRCLRDVSLMFCYTDLVIGGYKQQAVIVLRYINTPHFIVGLYTALSLSLHRTHSIANISLSLATNPQEQLEYNNPNCSVGSDMFAW